MDDQEIVWARGFGYADEANQILASEETIYRVGSISKLFTATAVMQLAEQGRIDIDTPLQYYLPEFSIKSRFVDSDPITPRNIMTHHSGLPTSWQKGMWNPNPESFSKVTYKIKGKYTSFPPNYVFVYSNLGVSLLGHMIENLSGLDFASYTKVSVLDSMGMTRSSFVLDQSVTPLLSKGYFKGRETKQIPLRDLPSGGLYSNVVDLGQFMKMVFGNGKSNDVQILEPQNLAEMFTPQNETIALDLDFRIGLGWFLSGLNLENGGRIGWHTGGTIMFHSQLIVLPEHKLGVVVLSNSYTARRVVDRVSLETIRTALETKTALKQDQEKNNDEKRSCSPSEESLDDHVGYYATTDMNLLAVNKVGEQLRATFEDRSFQLVPLADGCFKIQYKLLGLIPIILNELEDIRVSFAEINDLEVIVVHQHGERNLLGEKISPYDTSRVWLNRIGTYEICNLGTDRLNFKDVHLKYHDQLLVIDFTIPFFLDSDKSLVLKPISDTEAVILGLGSNMGETIRVVVSDGEEHLL